MFGKFSTLSYKTKIKIIFYSVAGLSTTLLFLVGIFFINHLSKEVNKTNQERVGALSLRVTDGFKEINDIIVELHKNNIIQENLLVNEENVLSNTERLELFQEIRTELDWILADKKSAFDIILLDNQLNKINYQTFQQISLDTKLINDMTVLELATSIDHVEGKWFFNDSLSEAYFVKNIYSTRIRETKKLATAIIPVSLRFIREFFEETGIYSKDDFVVLNYEGQYASSKIDMLDAVTAAIDKQDNNFSHNQSNTLRIGSHKYFIFTTEGKVGNHSFTFFYFLLNEEWTMKFISIIIIFVGGVLIFISLSLLLVDKYLNRLLDPLIHLSKTMKDFKEKKDFLSLRKNSLKIETADEVEDLYASFNQLIVDVEELIQKEYQAKLLSQEIEYKFLQAQLDPHFLYNTLNSINWMAIDKENYEISEMITNLSFLFRNKIDHMDDMIPIKEELDVINAYIKIQSTRFGNRLVYEEEIDESLIYEVIPKLTIQPLIENSIKYGVEKIKRPTQIKLTIKNLTGKILIEIKDDGPGIVEKIEFKKDSTGLGLSNIKNRLKLIYGDKASVKISSEPNIETKVILAIPSKN